MATFDFCPNTLVPETLPPEAGRVMSMNGWEFTSRPAVPYRRKFKVTLYGMRWYLSNAGLYDASTDPQRNARRLELFYQGHETWKEFDWVHPHIGNLKVKFSESVAVPAAMPNSGGLIEKLEVTLIESNPGFT